MCAYVYKKHQDINASLAGATNEQYVIIGEAGLFLESESKPQEGEGVCGSGRVTPVEGINTSQQGQTPVPKAEHPHGLLQFSSRENTIVFPQSAHKTVQSAVCAYLLLPLSYKVVLNIF